VASVGGVTLLRIGYIACETGLSKRFEWHPCSGLTARHALRICVKAEPDHLSLVDACTKARSVTRLSGR